MRGLICGVIFILALCYAAPSALAQADPIENYLASAEGKATNVVNNAGSQGRAVAMEAGQAVLNAIASFRAAYADSLDKTAAALSGQQAELFRNITSAVDRLDAYTRDTTTNLQGIADTLGGAVSNIPLSKDIPRVTRLGPIYFVEGATPAPELIVRGIGLSNSDPILELFGAPQRPHTETDTELRFQLPVRAVTGREPVLAGATLRLFERKSRFLFFSSYVPHTYPVRLAVYPKEIGTFLLVPRRRVTTVETQARTTPEYRCDSPHGHGSNTVPVSVVATPGWTIDTNTISYNRTYSNHGAFTMTTTSAAGFTATLRCEGWGRITGPFGVVIDAGSVGVEKGGFSYVESRPVTVLQNGEATTGTLRWGDSITFSTLPQDTETVILTLHPFTGQNLSIEGAGTNRFLALSFNGASKVATVVAKNIEESLRRN